jgi:hypothetical protein
MACMTLCTQGKTAQERRGCEHEAECRPRKQAQPSEGERDCDDRQQAPGQQSPEVSSALVLSLEEIKSIKIHLPSVCPPGVKKS